MSHVRLYLDQCIQYPVAEALQRAGVDATNAQPKEERMPSDRPWFARPVLRDLFWFRYLPWRLRRYLEADHAEH